MGKAIIERLKLGDEEAYSYLYRHHYAVLCYIAYNYVGDKDIAESLVSDVIFHLYEIRATLDIRGNLRSYLVKAVRNRALNYLHSNAERREVPFSWLTANEEGNATLSLPDESHPLEFLFEQELEQEIGAAINKLPEECRRVFVKSRFEEKKYEEIADELHISVNTVKYHIKNALAFLRKELARYFTWLLFIFMA